MNLPNEHHLAAELFRPARAWVLRWKRMLDIVVILLALPLLVPLVAVVAVLIRVVSAGPVLFKQERVGYLGRRFMCFKFRTMFVGADAVVHQGHLRQFDEFEHADDQDGFRGGSANHSVWLAAPFIRSG